LKKLPKKGDIEKQKIGLGLEATLKKKGDIQKYYPRLSGIVLCIATAHLSDAAKLDRL
jgi:hypothetical protein